MKVILLLFVISFFTLTSSAVDVIRINQLGYLPHSIKVAVFLSDRDQAVSSFLLIESLSGKTVFEGKAETADAGI